MTDVRCPVCRDVTTAGALSDHLRTHGDLQKFSTLWRLDRSGAILIAALTVTGSALIAAVEWKVGFTVGDMALGALFWLVVVPGMAAGLRRIAARRRKS